MRVRHPGIAHGYSAPPLANPNYPLGKWGTHIPSGVHAFAASHTVPQRPLVNAGQTVFWWGGLEPDDSWVVLQPVLGFNGRTGNISFSPWNCCPAGHTFAGTPLWVSPGDQLHADVTSNGGMDYVVAVSANGNRSQLNASDAKSFTRLLIALETYGVEPLNVAQRLPNGPLDATNITTDPPSARGSWGSAPSPWDVTKEGGWQLQRSVDMIRITPPVTCGGARANSTQFDAAPREKQAAADSGECCSACQATGWCEGWDFSPAAKKKAECRLSTPLPTRTKPCANCLSGYLPALTCPLANASSKWSGVHSRPTTSTQRRRRPAAIYACAGIHTVRKHAMQHGLLHGDPHASVLHGHATIAWHVF